MVEFVVNSPFKPITMRTINQFIGYKLFDGKIPFFAPHEDNKALESNNSRKNDWRTSAQDVCTRYTVQVVLPVIQFLVFLRIRNVSFECFFDSGIRLTASTVDSCIYINFHTCTACNSCVWSILFTLLYEHTAYMYCCSSNIRVFVRLFVLLTFTLINRLHRQSIIYSSQHFPLFFSFVFFSRFSRYSNSKLRKFISIFYFSRRQLAKVYPISLHIYNLKQCQHWREHTVEICRFVKLQ